MKLSLVLPARGDRYRLREVLDRALAIEVPDCGAIEILVVHAGPSAEVDAVLGDYERLHPERVRRIRVEAAGLGAAWCAGVAQASGDLILFVSGEPHLDSESCQRLLQPFVEDGADVVFGVHHFAAGRRRVSAMARSPLLAGLTRLSNLLTGLRLSAIDSPLIVSRAHLVQSVPIRSRGPEIFFELAAKIAKRRFDVFEVSILSARQVSDPPRLWRRGDRARALIAALRFWLVDDLYASDRYGASILTSLEKANRFNRWMADSIRAFVGNRVLEIGAGIGNITRALLPRDRYVATDINPDYLEFLRSLIPGRPHLAVSRIDLEDSSHFADLGGTFDTVVCLNVLEHVRDPIGALRNMRSALTEGGNLILYVPQLPFLYSSLDTVLEHRCRYTRENLVRELEAAGFQLRHLRTFNRAGTFGWFFNGKVMRRKSFGRVQLKVFDLLVPILRRVEPITPLPGLGLIAVAWRAPQS